MKAIDGQPKDSLSLLRPRESGACSRRTPRGATTPGRRQPFLRSKRRPRLGITTGDHFHLTRRATSGHDERFHPRCRRNPRHLRGHGLIRPSSRTGELAPPWLRAHPPSSPTTTLQAKGLSNWGCQHHRISALGHCLPAGAQVVEFKAMVKALHAADTRQPTRRGGGNHGRGQPHGPTLLPARQPTTPLTTAFVDG